MNTAKKYISLILLTLFLFPMVEKEVHTFQHASDSHCKSINKHFHKLEHSCGICDFVFCPPYGSSFIKPSFSLDCFSFSYSPSINCIYEINKIDNSGSRAPPLFKFSFLNFIQK